LPTLATAGGVSTDWELASDLRTSTESLESGLLFDTAGGCTGVATGAGGCAVVSGGGGVSAVVTGAMMDVGLAAGGGPGAATLSWLTAAEGGVTGSPVGELTTESTLFGLPALMAMGWSVAGVAAATTGGWATGFVLATAGLAGPR
jgi:hypothetical protein